MIVGCHLSCFDDGCWTLGDDGFVIVNANGPDGVLAAGGKINGAASSWYIRPSVPLQKMDWPVLQA